MKKLICILLCGALCLALASCGGNGDDAVTAAPGEKSNESSGHTGDVMINEYMADNESVLYDSDGDYSDWVELLNAGGSDADVSGWFLSDDDGEPEKWAFPDGTVIPAGGYLVVFLSGKSKVTESGELHASFKLGSGDSELVLSNEKGKARDSAELMAPKTDVSCGRGEDGAFVYFTLPTPGKANTGTGFGSLAAVPDAVPDVLINEVCAGYSRDSDKDYDWVELYNSSSGGFSLAGYSLCKDVEGRRIVFGDVTLDPGEYLVVRCVGRQMNEDWHNAERSSGDTVYEDGEGEAEFKISMSGGEILLLDPDGRIYDRFTTGKLRVGLSAGRVGGSRVIYDAQTPGEENSGVFFTGYCPVPGITLPGGDVKSGETTEIAAPAGYEIRYTLDGSPVTEDSERYVSAITVDESCALRAACFDPSGKLLPSDEASETYIIGRDRDLPVFSIISDYDGLYGYNRGIFAEGPGYDPSDYPYEGANFWKEWERPSRMEYYVGGEKQFCVDAGLMVFGQFSRARDMKNLAVHFRDIYGRDELTYPFFEDNDITTLSDLVLRQGDPYYNMLRDELTVAVLRGTTRAAYMDYAPTPVEVWINGEYNGLYWIREKINESYLESHYGIDGDNVDVVKGDSFAVAGTYGSYRELFRFAADNDLSDPANYETVCSMMDIGSFTDYLLAEIFFYNQDSGNIKCFRERLAGAKYYWTMFDFDQAMYMTARDPYDNDLSEFLGPNGHGADRMFSNTLIRSLMANDEYRQFFIERYAELLNGVFMPDNVLEKIDALADALRPGIPAQYDRWHYVGPEEWEENIDSIRETMRERRDICVRQLVSYLELSDSEVRALFPDDARLWDGSADGGSEDDYDEDYDEDYDYEDDGEYFDEDAGDG